MKHPGDGLDVDENHPLKKYEGTHKVVHLLEAYFRYDRTKRFTFSNVTPVFVNTQENRSLKFVTAKGNDHSDHFKEKNQGTWLQIFKSNLDSYYEMREDTVLCPFEFIQWYGKTNGDGEGDGDADADVDREVDGEVDENENYEDKPRMSICNDDWTGGPILLPEVILTKDQKMFIRRKVPKFVSYPISGKTDHDVMHIEVVLFKHHSKAEIENMTEEELEVAWRELDVFPDLDGQGHYLTKIETVKRNLKHPMCDANLVQSDVKNSEFVKIYVES